MTAERKWNFRAKQPRWPHDAAPCDVREYLEQHLRSMCDMTVLEMSPPASCRTLTISSGAFWCLPGWIITGAPSSDWAIAEASRDLFSHAKRNSTSCCIFAPHVLSDGCAFSRGVWESWKGLSFKMKKKALWLTNYRTRQVVDEALPVSGHEHPTSPMTPHLTWEPCQPSVMSVLHCSAMASIDMLRTESGWNLSK